MKLIKLNPQYKQQRENLERQARFDAAVKLVIAIDAGLITRTVHYRTKDGRLLTKLDQVVNAILADNLALAGEADVMVIERPFSRILIPAA